MPPSRRARAKAAALGIDVAADGAAALERRIGDETTMWRDVVAKTGIKIE